MTNDYSLTCDAENLSYIEHDSGYLSVASLGDVIALRCHWPFDFVSDEWIDIENAYDVPGYLRAVDDALTAGRGSARGIAGGYLHITAPGPTTLDPTLGRGFTLEFSRPASGWSASSLRLDVDRSLGDLLPEALPFKLAWQTRPLPSAA